MASLVQDSRKAKIWKVNEPKHSQKNRQCSTSSEAAGGGGH